MTGHCHTKTALLGWLIALCSLIFLAAPSHAASLYQGIVPVPDQSEESRKKAADAALMQVLEKVSGNAGKAQKAMKKAGQGKAADMMSSHSYERQLVAENGGMVEKWMLLASFKKSAVNSLLGSSGVVRWPNPRPAPVVWLAIDDGRGARLVSSSSSRAVSSLTSSIQQRGLNVVYPLMDAQDQVTATDLWQGNFAAVSQGTKRYPGQLSLAGKMFRDSGGWQAQWALLENSKVLKSWKASNSDAQAVLRSGAEGAANTLAARYREDILDGQGGSYSIWVADLDSARDYSALLVYLRSLPIISKLHVEEARPNAVKLRLQLKTSLESFERFLNDGDRMKRVGVDRFEQGVPEGADPFQRPDQSHEALGDWVFVLK